MSGEDTRDTLPSIDDPCPGESEEVSPPKRPLQDRLTVVSHVYHQRVGRNPKVIECKFTRDLESRQQVYERELEATEEWQPLDHGWLKDSVRMLVITNQEGQNLQVHPTDEEREATAKRVLCLAYGSNNGPHPCLDCCWLVPPGESFQGFPSQISQLCIRSQSGITEYTLYLIPR